MKTKKRRNNRRFLKSRVAANVAGYLLVNGLDIPVFALASARDAQAPLTPERLSCLPEAPIFRLGKSPFVKVQSVRKVFQFPIRMVK